MSSNRDRLPFAPFHQMLLEHAALRRGGGVTGEPNGTTRLAEDIGIDESQVRRWIQGVYRERARTGPHRGQLVTVAFESVSLRVVDKVTAALGVRIDELYPDLDTPLEPDAWCAVCGEDVTPVDGICPWCETRVAAGQRPDPLATLRERQAPARPGTGARSHLTETLVRAAMRAYLREPTYTAAARQVATLHAHPCRDERQFSTAIRNHFQRRGWWTQDDVRRALDGDVMARPVPYRGKLSPELLATARDLYEQGYGFRRIAQQLHERSGAASVSSLCNSLNHAFIVLGWPIRDRVEATRLASWKHGRKTREGHDEGAYRRWYKTEHGLYQPRCAGTRTDGKPCSKPALTGGVHCISHDPVRRAEQIAAIRRGRAVADARRGPMLDAAPLAALLGEQCAQHGTMVVARRLGIHKTRIWQLRAGKVQAIGRRTAQRYLDALGTGQRVEDLWPLRAIDGGGQADDEMATAA